MAATVSVGTKGWADRINAAWDSSVAGVIEAGRLLLEAKKQVKHGEFAQMTETQLRFKADTAQRLMTVARDARLTNAEHVRHLPSHYTTLYALSKLSDDEFQGALKNGVIRPDMERKDVPKPHKANGSTTITDAEYTEERSGTAREAPSTGMRDGAQSTVGVQPAAPFSEESSPAAPLAGDSAVPVEADHELASPTQAAAQDLGAGGPEADAREDGIAGVTEITASFLAGETAAMTPNAPLPSLALRPPGCPPNMVAYYITPGDPISGFSNGLAMIMAAVEQFTAAERAQIEVARQYPSDQPLYPDDLTKFVTWMMDFDEVWRRLHPRGNEAARSEEAVG